MPGLLGPITKYSRDGSALEPSLRRHLGTAVQRSEEFIEPARTLNRHRRTI